MKNLSLLFIAFLFLQFTTFAQEGWTLKNSGTSSSLLSIDFLNEYMGYIAGRDDIVKASWDGGESWFIYSGRLFPSYDDWYSICFVNEDDIYVCGVNADPFNWNEKWWVYTTNGGNNWIRPSGSFIPNTSRWSNVFFLNENLGWKVGYRNGDGRVVKSTTGVGSDWHSRTTVPEPLYSVMFVDENNGWMVGSEGAIYNSIDGGINWTLQISETDKHLKSVYFNNTLIGWSAGDRDYQAIILKTTNGGQSWLPTEPSGIRHLLSIYFWDTNIGWACGSISSTPSNKGVILYTDDGGDNWEVQHIENNCTVLYEIDFVTDKVGWVVGSNGVILKTTTGGVTDVYENEDYSLATYSISQNYPNPFNPTTTIKYQIPELSFVTLRVYDALGNEIAPLVNGEKSVGTYEITWYAENLPSGIYFYQLKAGEYVNTKKMLLLK